MIDYGVTFSGLDKAVVQWSTMNRLTKETATNVGKIGNGANGVTARGGTNIYAPLGGGVGVGAVEAAAAGGLAGSFTKSRSEIKAIVQKLVARAQEDLKISKRTVSKALERIHKLQREYSPQREFDFESSHQGAIPPRLRQSRSLFSATSFNNLFKSISDGITNVMKKVGHAFNIEGFKNYSHEKLSKFISSPSLEKIVGLFGRLAPILAAVIVGFEMVRKGIEESAEAYRHAAKLGTSVAGTFQLSEAFKAIGMEMPDLSMIKTQLEGKGNRDIAGVVLNAGRAGEFGEAQQLANMAQEFRDAVKDAATNAAQMEVSSRINLKNATLETQIGREWKTVLAQTAAVMEPFVQVMLQATKGLLIITNTWITQGVLMERALIHLLHLDKAFPMSTSQFGQITGGAGGRPSVTSWEAMGLVFPSAATANPAKQIDNSIKQTNKILTDIHNTIKQQRPSWTQSSPSTYGVPMPFMP